MTVKQFSTPKREPNSIEYVSGNALCSPKRPSFSPYQLYFNNGLTIEFRTNFANILYGTKWCFQTNVLKVLFKIPIIKQYL